MATTVDWTRAHLDGELARIAVALRNNPSEYERFVLEHQRQIYQTLLEEAHD